MLSKDRWGEKKKQGLTVTPFSLPPLKTIHAPSKQQLEKHHLISAVFFFSMIPLRMHAQELNWAWRDCFIGQWSVTFSRSVSVSTGGGNYNTCLQYLELHQMFSGQFKDRQLPCLGWRGRGEAVEIGGSRVLSNTSENVGLPGLEGHCDVWNIVS